VTLGRLLRATVRRGHSVVLDGVSLEPSPGERLAVVGGNGAGKTTLLRLLLGLERACDGVVQVAPTGCGYVPQSVEDSLFPWRSVLSNVAMPARLARCADADARAASLLELIAPTIDPRRSASRLSGGERQLVAIARALTAPGPMVLADEPFSALSPSARDRVRRVLDQQLGSRALVLVTHDRADVTALGARALELTGGHLEAA